MNLTNGRGCHIVINSVPTEYLWASLRCVKNFGIFIHIGLQDVDVHTKFGKSNGKTKQIIKNMVNTAVGNRIDITYRNISVLKEHCNVWSERFIKRSKFYRQSERSSKATSRERYKK